MEYLVLKYILIQLKIWALRKGEKNGYVGLFLLFCGTLLTGVGNCICETFGIPCIDGNMYLVNAPNMDGINSYFQTER